MSTTEYDAFGRRVATVDPPGNRTAYAYDRFGNLASATDSLGQVTTYAYDLRGRKIYEGGATYPVRFAYDVFGNRTAMATYRDEAKGPDSGDVTMWLYDDASGLVTNKVSTPTAGGRSTGTARTAAWRSAPGRAASKRPIPTVTGAISPTLPIRTVRRRCRSTTTQWAVR